MDENVQHNKESSDKQKLRLSFPFNSTTKENNFPAVNRRHTLVPNRSILKPNLEGSSTINLVSDTLLKERRRVSFAPEVTLHKIDYSRSNEERKLKKRNSFSGQLQSQPPKLNTSQYIWKSYQAVDNSKLEISSVSDVPKDEVHSFTSGSSSKFVIDEDSTTQTMELSAELTQEILKNRNRMKEQYLQSEGTGDRDQFRDQNSLRDVFEEVEEEINSDKPNTANDDEVDMELTEKFNKVVPNISSSNLMEISMELTQPAEHRVLNELPFDADKATNTDDDFDTMEFTQPITKSSTNYTPLKSSMMEITEPVSKGLESEIGVTNDRDETMEFTEPIVCVSPAQDDKSDLFEADKLSVVIEMPEPLTSDQTEPKINNSSNSDRATLQTTPPQTASPPPVHEIGVENENSHTNEKSEANSSIIEHKEQSSDMETSLIATEMIPLAEVTADFTENVEEYDSDNSLVDDNHINVSLDIFLRDVNVQFYDNIGPSNNEVAQTLIFNSDTKSSPFSESSPASLSAASSSSTPSSVSTTKRANLIEYIDACTNIPYYHYIIHLINQYQSSIQSISTMVNTFSNDVLESNPTAIREYYQQTEEIKVDLCTNYQAIATFTRKQAKCQNMRFLSGLLEQLISSYERANQFLESELGKALDWRRGILIKRQKMIERKVELNQLIQNLDTLRDNWNSINIDKIKKVNENLRNYGNKKLCIKQNISDESKLVSSKTKSLTDKKKTKEQLLKEVEVLRRQVQSSTVPSENDLITLESRLHSLEKSKSLRLLPGPDINLLISGKLKAHFVRAGDETYQVELSVNEIDSFSPFSELTNSFIEKQQKLVKRTDTMDFVKQLSRSWKHFMQIWKELITINFMYCSKISNAHFKFQFSFTETQHLHRNTVFVEGKLDDLLEPGKDVIVKLAKQDLLGSDKQIDQVGVLGKLRQIFNNKNSVVNRFVLG